MAVLMTPPYLQFFDANGAPLAGGKVYTYTATGTFSTNKATYTTEAGDVEHPNPVILDSAGRPDTGNGSIWLVGTYDFVVKDANDVTIETTLNVTAFTALPAASNAYFESFSGTGAQTAFTTSDDLGTDEKAIMVWVDAGGGKGYDLQAPSAYTISGTTLTFSVAPASGTNNVYVSAPSLLVGAASSSAAAAASSAAAALTSEGNASAAATTAGGFSNKWDFDSSTSMADPGSADIRLNNATLSSVTQIAISANSANAGNPDLSDYIVTWDDNVNASGRGTIQLMKSSANENFVTFVINGAITDNTTWLQIPVTYVASSGSFSNTDELFLGFARSGTDGAGTGTVTSITAGDGLSGGTITSTGTIDVDINGSTSGSVAATDEILFSDVDDSNNIKKDTVQGILDLAGAWVLLSTQTASSSATIDFTSGLDSTYKKYIFELIDVVPATDGQILWTRVSIDGGSSYRSSSGDYKYSLTTHDTSTGTTASALNSVTETAGIPLTGGTGVGSASGESLASMVELYNPAGTTLHKRLYVSTSYESSAGLITTLDGGGAYAGSLDDIDAVRFYFASGNIASGTFKLYGIK